MHPDRATDINNRLVEAWMVRERISSGALPDLSDVSMTEAIEASRIMGEPTPNPERPGVKVYTTHVEPTRVGWLWLWAMAEWHARAVEVTDGP